MEIICGWCKKQFVSVQNLKIHTETAKFCLKLRGEPITKLFGCDYCPNKFINKSSAVKHSKHCFNKPTTKLLIGHEYKLEENSLIINNLKTEVEELAEKVKELIDELHQKDEKLHERKKKIIELTEEKIFASGRILELKDQKPTTKIKNVVNYNVPKKLRNIKIDTIEPLTNDYITRCLQEYSYGLFLQGVDGLVSLVKMMIHYKRPDGLIERNLACTDPSRDMFSKLGLVTLLLTDGGGDDNQEQYKKEWIRDGKANSIGIILDLLADDPLRGRIIGKFRSYLERFIEHDIRAKTTAGFHYNEVTGEEENITIEQATINSLFICKLSLLCTAINNPDCKGREDLVKEIRDKLKDFASV